MANNKATDTLKDVSFENVQAEDNNSVQMGKDESKMVADYFDRLENEIDGGIFDEPTEHFDNKNLDSEEDDSVDNTPQQYDDEVDDIAKELENTKKRYESSSREAKRLNKRVQELEQFEPLIESLREHPELVDMVANYLENGGNANQGLGLPEDFVFDMNEALSNPSSDSAKALDFIVDKKLQAKNKDAESKSEFNRQIEQLKQTANASDEDVEDLIDWAKGYKLTLNDLYTIKNMSERDRKVARKMIEERTAKARQVREDNIRSLGSRGKHVDKEESPEQAMFKIMKQYSDGMDIFK